MRASPFFEGINQVELTSAGHTLRLPVFYYDGRAVTAVFPARLAGLRRLLPDSRFVPARLAPGVGLVGITAFEYADTDIGAYNELAISIVLHDAPYLPNLPGLALARSLRTRRLHAYVQHLPVTTELAWWGGRAFYNYPKFVAGIEISDRGGELRCLLSEGGHEILELTAPLIDARREAELQLFSHLWMDRQPQAAEFKLHATRMGECVRPRRARVELSSVHPIARELDAVLLSRTPIHLQHLERFEGILYGPEHLTLQLIAELQRETVGARL